MGEFWIQQNRCLKEVYEKKLLGTFVWIVSIVRFRASFFQFLQFFDLDLITLGACNSRD